MAGDGSQTLNATRGAGVDILIGGRGDDTLISDGGDDVLRGGEGDDVLALVDVDFSGTRSLVGGNGTDTLRLDGTGFALDLRSIADNRITGIEQIDLSGGGNELSITLGELLGLSDSSNTLTVRGGGADRLFVRSGIWNSEGIVNLGGTDYEQYASGAATLNVEVGLAATFSAFSAKSLSTLDGTNGFILTGIDSGDFAGSSVSNAGDVNGDGFDDLIIGAFRADQPGGTEHGETYVVFGRSGGFASSIALSTLDGTTGFVLTGIDGGDQSGRSVSSAGDVNGDGFDDLIIGAAAADQTGGNNQGESYVLFGRSGGFASSIALSTLDGTTGFVLTGIDGSDQSGFSVSGAGDVNGDGFDDLIIGAIGAVAPRRGESYVVFGKSGRVRLVDRPLEPGRDERLRPHRDRCE